MPRTNATQARVLVRIPINLSHENDKFAKTFSEKIKDMSTN